MGRRQKNRKKRLQSVMPLVQVDGSNETASVAKTTEESRKCDGIAQETSAEMEQGVESMASKENMKEKRNIAARGSNSKQQSEKKRSVAVTESKKAVSEGNKGVKKDARSKDSEACFLGKADDSTSIRENGHASVASKSSPVKTDEIVSPTRVTSDYEGRNFQSEPLGARIKVIGIGGGGGNAVCNMISSGLKGVEFIVANTDVQALRSSDAPAKLQLGTELTKGLGAGADPMTGRRAAEESIDDIREALQGADMVFVTAGMGGGTGGGGAAVVASVARELGALTVGVITKPFLFEGKRRMVNAETGLDSLKKEVDTLITIPNQRLLSVSGRNTTLLDTFRKADNVLYEAVRGISHLILFEGLVNVDFADVKAVMSEMGMAMMGTGEGVGENRAVEAAEKAISSPLLEDISISGARGVLINVTAGSDVTLQEINEAAELIHAEAHDEANIIWGMVIDPDMGDNVRVTVIATGFGEPSSRVATIPSATVVAPKVDSLASEKTLEVPTFTRRQKEQEPEVLKLKKISVISSNNAEEEEKYEIPTFLRRQVD